jgi:hypothetical protein
MKRTKVYMQGVSVLTRVNGCENKIWVVVHTDKPLTDKPTRKKVFAFLMKEFGIEGMYGMSFDDHFKRTLDIENVHHYDFLGNNRYFIY